MSAGDAGKFHGMVGVLGLITQVAVKQLAVAGISHSHRHLWLYSRPTASLAEFYSLQRKGVIISSIISLTRSFIAHCPTFCCRYLRQQIEARGLSDVDLGPDEQKLWMKSEPERSSSQQQEIEKLGDDLVDNQTELDAFERRVSVTFTHHSVLLSSNVMRRDI